MDMDNPDDRLFTAMERARSLGEFKELMGQLSVEGRKEVYEWASEVLTDPKGEYHTASIIFVQEPHTGYGRTSAGDEALAYYQIYHGGTDDQAVALDILAATTGTKFTWRDNHDGTAVYTEDPAEVQLIRDALAKGITLDPAAPLPELPPEAHRASGAMVNSIR